MDLIALATAAFSALRSQHQPGEKWHIICVSMLDDNCHTKRLRYCLRGSQRMRGENLTLDAERKRVLYNPPGVAGR